MSATVCDKTNRVIYQVIGFRPAHDRPPLTLFYRDFVKTVFCQYFKVIGGGGICKIKLLDLELKNSV